MLPFQRTFIYLSFVPCGNAGHTTPHNIIYKILGFRWLLERFCPASAFATADRDEARNPQHFIYVTVTCKVEKKKNKLILRDITKLDLRMSAPKRFCFAHPLLPFGTVWETHPHCSTFASPHKPTHNPKAFKRAAILPTHHDIIYYF